MVYSGLFPVDNAKFNDLREALEKLQLNDAALEFEPETSQALGFGFRCGFLGLSAYGCGSGTAGTRFGLDLIVTATERGLSGSVNRWFGKTIDNPAEMPDASEIKEIRRTLCESIDHGT